MKIILLSHGNLAQSFYETTCMIYGHADNLGFVNLTADLHTENYQKRIEEEIISQTEVMIIVDMLGGTPFIVATNIYRKFSNSKKIDIITGLNLPMLLEILPHIKTGSIEEIKKTAMEAGKLGIVDLREILK